jgi:hypothetical protein
LARFKTRVSIREQSASEWQNCADSQLLQASSLSVTAMAQPSLLTRLTSPLFCATFFSLIEFQQSMKQEDDVTLVIVKIEN